MLVPHGSCCLFWRKALRLLREILVGGGMVLLLSSCGGGGRAKPRRSAKKQIQAAESAIARAQRWEEGNTLPEALEALDEAAENIAKGKKFARGAEKKELIALDDEVAAKVARIKERKAKLAVEKKKKQEEEAAKKKLAAMRKTGKNGSHGKTAAVKGPVRVKSPEEIEQERKAAEKAKAEKEEAELAALLHKKDVHKTVVKEEGEGEGSAKDGAGAHKPIKPGQGPTKAPSGPFKNLGKNPPSLSIDKVRRRGDYAYAYIQLYNKNPHQNKRIGRVTVVFKDAGNGRVGETPYIFQYSLFDKSAKDPTDQPNAKCALTAASHEVIAGSILQLVAVGHFPGKASRAKKAAVEVSYEDGSSDSGSGPGSALDGDQKLKVPGL